jgi:hypothetical protein
LSGLRSRASIRIDQDVLEKVGQGK